MAEKTTYPNPNRPPKKFTAKSLHGRTRLMVMTYTDLHRFMNFYIKTFGWDMIEMPEAASGIPAGDPKPCLLYTSRCFLSNRATPPISVAPFYEAGRGLM